jgi:hypothetical protein
MVSPSTPQLHLQAADRTQQKRLLLLLLPPPLLLLLLLPGSLH